MEFSGTIYEVMPKETGEGQKGIWVKQPFVIEMPNGKYNTKVAISLWGELADTPLERGAEIVVDANVESKESKGRWYTDVRAWKVIANSSK